MKRKKGRKASQKPPKKARGVSAADLERLLTCISHEFRTPLNSIVTLSDLALGGPDGRPPPEEVIEFMSIIRADGRRLLRLVEKLIMLADVEAGKAIYNIGPVAVEEAVNAAKEELGAPEAALRIDENLAAKADPAKFRLIIRELLENAFLHGLPGGPVSVAGHSRDKRALLTITNEMDPSQRADPGKVFGKFVQGNSGDLTAKPPGLGVGLTLCRCVARAMRGTVTCRRPAPGLWTAVVDLPLAAAREGA